MRVKTKELIDLALDWAVAKCEGYANLRFNPHRFFRSELIMTPPRCEHGAVGLADLNYGRNYSLAGPIIEREWLDITPWPNESDESLRWGCRQHDRTDVLCFGLTPLVAAMRCYVASKLGDKVEIPKELLQCE